MKTEQLKKPTAKDWEMYILWLERGGTEDPATIAFELRKQKLFAIAETAGPNEVKWDVVRRLRMEGYGSRGSVDLDFAFEISETTERAIEEGLYRFVICRNQILFFIKLGKFPEVEPGA